MAYLFPLKDGTLWRLTTFDALAQAHPRLDVLVELKKAALWLQANPGRRKTKAGMLRFLTAWLNRADPVVSAEVPFSREELQQARQVMRARLGCRCEPRCRSAAACEGKLIQRWRAERREAAGL